MSHLCKKCKHAREYEYACPIYGYVFASHCECDRFEEKEDKYRWHNLLKDPTDLPRHCNKVLCVMHDRNEEYPKKLNPYSTNYFVNAYDVTREMWLHIYENVRYEVIAWKYIAPFEVEE